MKAARQHRYGGLDVISIDDVPIPTPAAHQVLVRVHAASVNRGDLDGLVPKPKFIRLFAGIRAPRNKRMGIDVAGVVEAVGSAVSRLAVGDRVFGDGFRFGMGSFAEYVTGSAEVFERIPDGLAMDEAATIPHSAVLALQGLRHRDGRTFAPGARVLIDGASGSVGPYAVQLAKLRGAEVTGTCRTEKVDFVRSFGADHAIDYTTTDYTKTGERYDWICDTDSHHSLWSVRRALTPNGTYVTLGGSDSAIVGGLLVGPLVSRFSRKWTGLMTWWKPMHRPDIETINGLLEAGSLRPAIDRRYPLDQLVEALGHVEAGRAKGKVVITMAAGAD